MEHFDFESVARDAGIPPEDLDRLCRIMREEFPHDEMMFELHMLRACRAIRDGDISLDEALGAEQAKAA